jgi:hypothetical protein
MTHNIIIIIIIIIIISAVGIATGYGLGRNSIPGRGENFLFSMSSRPVLGPTQPPIQRVPGALSPELKRQGREADHSLPTSAEVKKRWIYTSTPPYAFKEYLVFVFVCVLFLFLY